MRFDFVGCAESSGSTSWTSVACWTGWCLNATREWDASLVGTAGGAGGTASLQLWRNTEHFSGALAAVLRYAEKMGANLDVMKREGAAARSPREGTRDDVCGDIKRRHRRDYVFEHVCCHSVHMRGYVRWLLASQ
ncbi:hypothetical protein EDB83DRAFT_2553131 [Lactarius deliciosus]|nr:hypothetical protein EDB83DRAFT_2553131 [Lactarius deliciosus]